MVAAARRPLNVNNPGAVLTICTFWRKGEPVERFRVTVAGPIAAASVSK
jgi:hypothetical protein